jgi:hypothetical protein
MGKGPDGAVLPQGGSLAKSIPGARQAKPYQKMAENGVGVELMSCNYLIKL